MDEKLDIEKLTFIASEEEMRNEFLSQVVELREVIEAQIGEIADLVHKNEKQYNSSRRVALFW